MKRGCCLETTSQIIIGSIADMWFEHSRYGPSDSFGSFFLPCGMTRKMIRKSQARRNRITLYVRLFMT